MNTHRPQVKCHTHVICYLFFFFHEKNSLSLIFIENQRKLLHSSDIKNDNPMKDQIQIGQISSHHSQIMRKKNKHQFSRMITKHVHREHMKNPTCLSREALRGETNHKEMFFFLRGGQKHIWIHPLIPRGILKRHEYLNSFNETLEDLNLTSPNNTTFIEFYVG